MQAGRLQERLAVLWAVPNLHNHTGRPRPVQCGQQPRALVLVCGDALPPAGFWPQGQPPPPRNPPGRSCPGSFPHGEEAPRLVYLQSPPFLRHLWQRKEGPCHQPHLRWPLLGTGNQGAAGHLPLRPGGAGRDREAGPGAGGFWGTPTPTHMPTPAASPSSDRTCPREASQTCPDRTHHGPPPVGPT